MSALGAITVFKASTRPKTFGRSEENLEQDETTVLWLANGNFTVSQGAEL